MTNNDKLLAIEKHLKTLREDIEEIERLSYEELKDLTKIVLSMKGKLLPEITDQLNQSLDIINEVLNENTKNSESDRS